jgi:hypothetical protein
MFLAQSAAFLRVAEGRSGRNPTPALLRVSAIPPLWGEWRRRCPLSYTTFLLDYFPYPLSDCVV